MCKKVKPVMGQCGTCKFADAFDYADSPSGPEDGVHCTSEAMAKDLDSLGNDTHNQEELKESGFMNLWRLETLAEESYRCKYWEMGTRCPDCGEMLTEVIVERFQTQTFLVNHEKKEITPLEGELGWEVANDYAYHCPKCDSLNVDEMLHKYELKGV